MKKKFVSITNMAAPYQVKFANALEEYYDTEFWFYTRRESNRPKWWETQLGHNCKVLKYSGNIPIIGYFSFGLIYELIKAKPDVILLGGFMKWHVLVLWLARTLGIKVAIYTEAIRSVKVEEDTSDELLRKENHPFKLRVANRLFSSANLYIGMGDVAKKQLIEEFDFPEEKVTTLVYPQDLEPYFHHELRKKENGEQITLLFANRLVERYQPLIALEVLRRLTLKYPNIRMLMNAEGSEKQKCDDFIKINRLKNVEYLEKIDSWDNMHLIYENSDILILPCLYSNGNGSIIEARASGMGIVISNQIHNIERHSKHDRNCFICGVDVDEFEKAVSQYLDNPDLLVQHGKLSKELVKYRRNDYTAKFYFEVFQKYGLND